MKFALHFESFLFPPCSEEIRGEVLFVLYKLSVLQSTTAEGDGSDMLIPFCPKLLYLLGDVLLKTQNDDVRLNCIGPLLIFQYYFVEKKARHFFVGCPFVFPFLKPILDRQDQ